MFEKIGNFIDNHKGVARAVNIATGGLPTIIGGVAAGAKIAHDVTQDVVATVKYFPDETIDDLRYRGRNVAVNTKDDFVETVKKLL